MPRSTYAVLICGLMLGHAVASGGVGPLFAQTVNVTEPTRVITRDDLRSLGVTRLGDIVYHIDEARALSLDGFGTRMSFSGIGSFHESAPVVFVDGHPIDLGLIASGDLNLLGLSVEVIDHVEIYARPALIAGVFAGHGAIHITTKQADDAEELHGRVSVAREDGKAGRLFDGDGEQTANANYGPDLEVAVLGELANGSATAAVVHRRHAHADRTDNQVRPLTVVTSPFSAFTWTDQRLQVSVIGLGMTADRSPYLPYASRILATEYRGAVASAMAAHRMSGRSFLRHRATVSLSRSSHDHDPGTWNESSILLTSALTRTLEERVVVLGSTAELRRANAGDATGDVRWGSVFAAIAGSIAPGAQYRGGGMVAMDGRSVAVKAYGGITLARWANHRADVYLAVIDGLLHEQNAADFWAREQLTPPLFPDDVGRPAEDVTIKATFDAEWRWQPAATNEVRVGAGLRRSPKIYLPSQNILPAAGGGLRESVEFGYTSGTQGVFWGEFTTHVLPGRQRLFWSWQRTIVGGDTYERAWDAVPDIRAGLSLATPMFGGFQMRANVTRESGRNWQEFDTATIRSTLSGSTLVDVYVTKRLLSGQMHASVSLQNALGQEITHHPLGDTFGRSIHVDVRLDLIRRR